MATNTFDRDREPLDPWRETNPFPELQGPALEVSLAEEGLIADETTSLLANNGTGHDAGWGDEADEQEQRRRVEVHIAGKFSRDMRALGPKEVKTLLLFSAPLVMTNLVQISMRVVDVWFVGHLGPTELAAAALGGMYTMVAGVSLGWGMTTAMDTLSSQAHTGATDPHMAGLILQRAILIVSCICVPISALWLNAERILIGLGQVPELAHMAQQYIWIILPGLLPNLATACMRKYLQAQGLMRATTYIVFMVWPLNLLSNIFYLRILKLGFIGAPLAICTTYYCNFIITILYIRFATNYRKSWGGWSWDAFRGWTEYLRLGIPGMLSVLTDWAFEFCALAAGVLGKTSLAAQSIVTSSVIFLVMIPVALAMSSAVRVGHNLGALRPNEAKVTAWWSVIVGIIVCSCTSSLMIMLRHRYPTWFTEDTDVIGLVAELLPIAAATMFCMGIGAVLSGILNGSGRQRIVALLNIVSYYTLGLPLGLFLAFKRDMGIIGIWWGVFTAGIIKVTGEILVVRYTNWAEEAERAIKRVRNAKAGAGTGTAPTMGGRSGGESEEERR